ncbi:hypothetical protein T4D_8558 [Trichinella pseudospiralis]|uniref:Uncharacterized protein n=1 Tax=Trichinella pseudospiralis TaxID=6337 RepID=A0A0V1FVR6_TRIPS|nr:hypothetical protein T4D_8558 [Trichinella pseudospiralis]
MESEDCLWSRKEQYFIQIQNRYRYYYAGILFRYRNVQAADMVVYVQDNLWSTLQSTLQSPCQIKFLWRLVADVYVSFYGRFFVPITMASLQIVKRKVFRYQVSIYGKYVSEAWPGASPRADDFGKFENLKIFLNLASGNAPGVP